MATIKEQNSVNKLRDRKVIKRFSWSAYNRHVPSSYGRAYQAPLVGCLEAIRSFRKAGSIWISDECYEGASLVSADSLWSRLQQVNMHWRFSVAVSALSFLTSTDALEARSESGPRLMCGRSLERLLCIARAEILN